MTHLLDVNILLAGNSKKRAISRKKQGQPVLPKRTGDTRLVKKNGYTVAIGGRRISQTEVRKYLDEFP